MRMAKAVAVGTLALLGIAPEAGAQAQLDAPSLRVVAESRVSVHVDVQAGPSGAPAGFVVEWMKKSDYDALQGWPAEGDPRLQVGRFTGTPTLNPSTGSYLLAAGGYVEVELGDLFDETGVEGTQLGELDSDLEIVLRARALSTPEAAESDYSTVQLAKTQPLPIANCTYTQGFWKTHPAQWPVGSLTLGTVTYGAGQLLDILETPAEGNGLVILAHQLIASLLSIANGADPTPVAAAVNDAHALIGGLVVPSVGSDWLDPLVVNDVKDALDQYNNGLAGVPHCGPVATRKGTWGAVKGAYR